MKEAILLIIAGTLAVIYNIMVLGEYSLHQNGEIKNNILFFNLLLLKQHSSLPFSACLSPSLATPSLFLGPVSSSLYNPSSNYTF